MIIIDSKTLRELGVLFLEHIKTRTLEGLDKDNKPFKRYSSNTFAMPSGAVTKRAKAILRKNGDLKYYRNSNGAVWIVVNGYIKLKKAVMAKSSYDGTVNLNLTGAMMRSFTLVKVGGNTITLGFTRTEEANKARYNVAAGRDFLGFTLEGGLLTRAKDILIKGDFGLE